MGMRLLQQIDRDPFLFWKKPQVPRQNKRFRNYYLDILFAMAVQNPVQNINLKVLSIICSCWENILHVAIGNLETLMTWSTSTAV